MEEGTWTSHIRELGESTPKVEVSLFTSVEQNLARVS